MNADEIRSKRRRPGWQLNFEGLEDNFYKLGMEMKGVSVWDGG